MDVPSFFWYFRPEDFNEDGTLSVNISAGRLRHRWVPQTRHAARIFLRDYQEAEGLRQASNDYILVQLKFLEPINDLSDAYPNAVVHGIPGYVIRTPMEVIAERMPSKRAVERGVSMPEVAYHTTQTDLVQTYKPKQFGALEMGLMTADEIRAMSQVEVTSAGAFQDNDAADNQTPVLNGVHDLRMGSSEPDQRCMTCSLTLNTDDGTNSCQGHFGHISLAKPIPKLQFLGTLGYEAKGTDPILNSLNSVCFSCYRINLPQGTIEGLKERVMSVFDLNRRNYNGYVQVRTLLNSAFNNYHGTSAETKQVCPHCGEFSPKVGFNHASAQFRFKVPDERYQGGAATMEYDVAHFILQNVRDEDCFYLGMDPSKARPENMFFTAMPVAPNLVRPQLSLPGKKMKELNDLTKLYQDVVASNDRLEEIMITRAAGEERFTQQLYYAVSRVYDNHNSKIGSGGTMMQRGYGGAEKSVSFKGVMNRLSGKNGRFRNNLQSKYVEEVSYSVITPNADLAIDEVGVPKKVAMNASVLETVTAANYERMIELIVTGSGSYPGANYIIQDGDQFNKGAGNYKIIPKHGMTEERARQFLMHGSKVMRHVINGDIALFNRAPSLHRQSILAMRCRILEAKSLGMNPTVCIPFNADYDGDAMKLHFVQSEEAIAEAKKWMQLDKNIIHARYGKLTVATDQDQTSGLYLLTHTDKRRKNEWNPETGLGFTDEGIPYFDQSLATRTYTYVYSEIRNEAELKEIYKAYKKSTNEKPIKYEEWRLSPTYRTINSLPESDYTTPDGNPAYTGRAIFSHLFTVLDCEYVSATFEGNTPAVDEVGNIKRKDNGKEIKDRIIVYKGKLIKGTIEKDSFGEGGSSLAPPFIYHEGYERGQEKLVEFIEMVTRLGYAGHHAVGYTIGVGDVNVYSEKTKKMMDQGYEEASRKIEELQRSYIEKDFLKFAEGESERIQAITAPADFIEEKIVNAASSYENDILTPIKDEQGSGNSMQIAVRSKARGKDLNIRQMCGSYGIVLVGGKRIIHGVNPFRALPHMAKGDLSAKNTGFVKSGYAVGMKPIEYWQTSSAGRRSAVESGQGNISKSGYLERKMIKAFEPVVVNDRKQVVNVRTGRMINPLVGDDGLAPYHIRGSHEDTNTNGHILTLQPLLFDFDCRHGFPLESAHVSEYSQHKCDACNKSSNTILIRDEVASMGGFQPSERTLQTLESKIEGREILTPTLRKIAKRLHEFQNDSICRTGEAIGATAGGCLGEPATQAALRTFHFAGKMSFQGSVDRLQQMLESPVSADANINNPQTTVMLKEGATEELANKLAAICRHIEMDQVVDVIMMDPQNMMLKVVFNAEKIRTLRLGGAQGVFRQQIIGALDQQSRGISGYEILSQSLDFNQPYTIRVLSNDRTQLMRAKESILGAKVAGITQAKLVAVNEKDGRYQLDIRDARGSTLNRVISKLEDYLDLDTLKTNNLGWIYNQFGLEAMLDQFIAELDFQMNGSGGVGEYDVRYIRMIADLMGEEGEPMSLGPKGTKGLGSPANYSVLSAASVEGVPNAILGGALMGNRDELRGPAEAIISGATTLVGDYVPTSQ